MSQTTKNFESLHDAYAFFQDHTSEAEQDRLGYLRHLVPLADAGRPVRLLDFGCGDGGFLADTLARAGFDPGRLTIALVEPDAGYREQAVARLAAFTSAPVTAWPALPDVPDASFDLVLSNHALYYVPDLAATVTDILRVTAPGGLFLTTMGDGGNIFAQWSDTVYAALGESRPHTLSVDLEAVLGQLGQSLARENIFYDLDFPDTEANRVLILRFMLGQFFGRMDLATLLRLFDPYVTAGRVTVRSYHYQFAIRR